MSDSHGDLKTIEQIAALPADAYFHCGDSELTADHEALHKFQIVRGNCDVDQNFPEEVITTVNGLKVMMVHGHLHQVKSSLMRLFYEAKEYGANIALFGHSHLYGAEMKDGVLFVNPGSTMLPRGGKEASYAIIEWADQITVTFKNMYDEVIDQVQFSK